MIPSLNQEKQWQGSPGRANRRLRALFPSWAVLSLLLTGIAAPSQVSGQRASLEKFLHQRVLPNGMEVIVVENHGVPLATIEIDVRNGAFTQPQGFEGLAHMYEHMFFKANRELPRPDEFIQRASELGAVFNAETQEERVNYYMTLPKDSISGGMKLMAAALREPLFLEEELERERQVVLGEYDRNESNPFFQLTRELGQLLYPGQWSRKNVIGERKVLETVTPAKLREIQRLYYIPNNSVLIIAGDVEPSEAFALAEREFGDWQRGPDPFTQNPIPPIPPLEKNESAIVEQPVNAVTVYIQWQGPSVRQDPAATYAADVFSDAINQPGSAFQRRLVDSGLFQSVGFNYYTLNQVGPISVVGQTTPEKLRDALAALDQEIARLGTAGYITADELAATKAERSVSTAFGVDRASEFAHTLGFWWSVADLEYYMGYVDNMAKQTLQDLRNYANKYVVGKHRVTGILIDAASRQRIGLTASDLMPRTAQ